MNLNKTGTVLNIDFLKPFARALKYNYLILDSKAKIALPVRSSTKDINYTFIIGCGRSGTTLLGEILSFHPNVRYYFEPYHLWFTINSNTDILNLFDLKEGQLFLNRDSYDTQSLRKFERLFQATSSESHVFEKTPLNVFRMDYIKALAPSCKFIHIVRDGADVCSSISRLAHTNSYKILGKPTLNQWWGVDNSKWSVLLKYAQSKRDSSFDDIGENDHLAKGALEWILSIQEAETFKSKAPTEIYELKYSDLLSCPERALESLFGFLGMPKSQNAMEKSVSLIEKRASKKPYSISLPDSLVKEFNHLQAQYGFSNYAVKK